MKQIWFYVLISFGLCTCQETNDTRCSIYDSACQKDYFQNVGRTFAYTGISALGIPIIDPFNVTSITLSILGLLDLNFQGEAVGIGKCIVTKFKTNVEARYRQPEVICDKIVIRGQYKLTSAPIVGKICGWCDVSGEGNGTITLENWVFKFRYPFKVLRQPDGKIYLNGDFEKAVYEASVEKVVVEADSIIEGHRDITRSIIKFINNNWKLIMDSYIGKFINDKSAQYYYDIYGMFFERVPANQYFKDDLSPLVDN